MQTITHTDSIEQMLDSADHLIENHRGSPARFDRATESTDLPEGWILYSANCEMAGVKKDWNVELLDTTRPYNDGSIVTAEHQESLDAALREAGRKILTAKSGGRG
jgi:hypothetical protein